MIKINQLKKRYPNNQHYCLNNINLTIADGEILILLGASGSGKTTLLKTLNRLISIDSGDIIIDGKNINDIDPIVLRRQMGYAFQKIGLFPHLNVEDNISIVLRLGGMPLKKRIARAHELLSLVNLEPKKYAKRYPDELSGGQQQRVGVARALANNPKYLLMDEPFGALDAINRDELQTELLRLNTELHKTIIFVTHDIHEALRLADTIAVIHQGEIQQVGDKQSIVKQPKTEFVRDLFATFTLDDLLS